MKVSKYLKARVALVKLKEAKSDMDTTKEELQKTEIKEAAKKFFKYDSNGELIYKTINGVRVPKINVRVVLFNVSEAIALFAALYESAIDEID